MHVFITSPALAEIISHQILREDPPSRKSRRTGRAERRAARRAHRTEQHLPSHRVARALRLAH